MTGTRVRVRGAEPETGPAEHAPGPSVMGRMVQAAEDHLVPLTASIELTLRCNLACDHCYNYDRSGPAPAGSGPELSRAEVLDLIDQLADAGTLFLSFTGGEAMVAAGLEDYVRHARASGFAVKVKSNGTLLDRGRAERLAAAGVMGVEISLYGADAATHDGLTNRPGSFAATVRGMAAARDAGMDVRASLVIHRAAGGQVGAMIALTDELGVGHAVSHFITSRYDGTDGSLDHQIDRAALKDLYEGPLAGLRRSPAPDRDMRCGCARSNCGISATGDVYPCIGAPLVAGNLRRQSFAEIWARSPTFEWIRGLRTEDLTACVPCPDRPWCRRSPGVVYSNTGDYTGTEPFTCMDASVAHELDRPGPEEMADGRPTQA